MSKVRKQQSEVQFESEAIVRDTGRRQVQSTHEEPDYLKHAISIGEMDFKSREHTERESGVKHKVGAAFKNKHRKYKHSLAAAEARQRKANAKSVSVAQNIIGFVKSHNLPCIDSVSDHKSHKSPRIIVPKRDKSVKNFEA